MSIGSKISSVFSSTARFLDRLFKRVRPGFEAFWRENQDKILPIIEELYARKKGIPFVAWKTEAFDATKYLFARAGISVPDTWIDILVNFAFEQVKARLSS